MGCMLLCDVALGDMNRKYAADYYADQLPEGKHSTMGCGKNVPNPSGHVVTEEGVVVPTGKQAPANLETNSSLLYNEYIVYDTAQVRMKYLFKLKFNHKF